MYNRYIPQPDGTWRKKQVQETARSGPPPQPPEPPKPVPPKPPAPREPPPPPPERVRPPDKPHPPCHSNGGSVGGFLRQLLPRDFDTGDLFVILLLLLMAGEGEEGRNSAFLTLILYLCM